jgi:DNA-binding CsgD family transcriptional regulator
LIHKEIEKHIRKLVGTLKEEEALTSVLKARLTKKEYKLLLGWAEGTAIEEISKRLKLDEESYGTLSEKLIKKLNQEKLKQELVD